MSKFMIICIFSYFYVFTRTENRPSWLR